MKTMKSIIMTLILGLFFTLGTMAQQSPRPPSDGTSGGNQAPSGGATGAPIESGTTILFVLAFAYGVRELKRVKGLQGKFSTIK